MSLVIQGTSASPIQVKRIEKDINKKPLDAWRQGQSHLNEQIKLFIFNMYIAHHSNLST